MGIMIVLRIKDGASPEMEQKCKELYKRLEKSMLGSAVDAFWVYDIGKTVDGDYKINMCLSSEYNEIDYTMELHIMPENVDTLINVERGGLISLIAIPLANKEE